MVLSELIMNLHSIYANKYVLISLFSLLLIASYFDIKYKIIPDKLNLIFLVIRLLLSFIIGIKLDNIFGLIVGFLLVLIPAMIKNKPMGGDIKLMTVLGFYLGVKNIFILAAGTVVFSLLYAIPNAIKQKKLKDFPLAPFILLSYVSMVIISAIV